jgi:hypothetical protein
VFDELMQATHKEIFSGYRGLHHQMNHELFDRLDEISQFYQKAARSGTQRTMERQLPATDPGTVLKNVLLNQDPSKEIPAWQYLDKSYTTLIDNAIGRLGRVFGNSTGKLTPQQFGDLSTELQTLGIPNRWRDVYQFAQQQGYVPRNAAGDLIGNLSNLMVTLNLRLAELAHAGVTTLSAPIMILGQGGKYPLQNLMKGARMLVAPTAHDAAIMQRAKDRGLTQRFVAEATEHLQSIHANPSKIAQFNNSKIVKFLSTPTDKSEEWVRELAFATGWQMTKAAHSSASESVLEAGALAFMKRSMGNYTTRQRPIMFQGNFGATIGLYQTFMLTMAQTLFRHVEKGDRRAILTMLGSQAGLFGGESLPGYGVINRAIGSWANDDHADITSIAYELFGNGDSDSLNAAEFILFGAPSALMGTALHTRAQLDPRLPVGSNVEGGVSLTPPIMSMIAQAGDFALNAGQNLANTIAAQGSVLDWGKSINQAVSMQSMWRPGARIAEMMQGYSVDRKGAIVDKVEYDLANMVPLALTLGSRPLKEQALRNVRYTNRYYAGVDRTARQQAVGRLRVLATGNSSMDMGAIFNRYIDAGGSAAGWKQALNSAYMEASTPLAQRLQREVSKNQALTEILENYE